MTEKFIKRKNRLFLYYIQLRTTDRTLVKLEELPELKFTNHYAKIEIYFDKHKQDT